MRLLYLCHRIPYPPDKGDKIRAFHQLRGIGAVHEVDVFTLVDDPADLIHRAALERYCRSLTVAQINPRIARLKALPYLLTGTALTLPYFHSAELERQVRKAVLQRSYDRVLVFSSAMAQYIDGIEEPIVMDLVDVDSDKWIQYSGLTKFPFSSVYRREGKALRRFERHVCEQSDAVIVTTDREANLVREISTAARVHVIPNGVDTQYFQPAASSASGGRDRAQTITFLGDMSYFANEEAVVFFANRVFPIVRQTIASARFLIVGRKPSRRVRQLKGMEGVEITGWVPDVRPYLAATRVSVAPFRIAAGIQNKILESMACGLPVVATRRAVQGVAPAVARSIETADEADDLAAKVVYLLKNPQIAQQRGLEGRECVTAHYSWDRHLELLLQLVDHPARDQSWDFSPAAPSGSART